MNGNNQKFYTVGKFARKAGVTVRTIQYYDERGLLKPSEYSQSGYRLYSEQDFAKLQKILTLKYLGFSLEQIEDEIMKDSSESNLKESLSVQKKILKEKLSHMAQVIKSIEETEKMLEKNSPLEWDSFVNIIKAINNENALLEQYKNSLNLKARISIHDRYSTNKYGWHRWLFDKIDIPQGSKVLEIGCGDGSLWSKNTDRIPNGCQLYLTDASKGMLEDSRRNLKEVKGKFLFEVANAEQLPYEDSTFDVVIANHVLFYVKDIKKAFLEVKRVLKKGGRLYASTIGEDHMIELSNLASEFDNRVFFTQTNPAHQFGLENGKEQLEEWFNEVKLFIYEDSLLVNEVEPLIDYIYSTHGNVQYLLKNKKEELTLFLRNKLSFGGDIYIRKSSGLFKALNNKK